MVQPASVSSEGADDPRSKGVLSNTLLTPLPRAAVVTVIAPDGTRWTTNTTSDTVVVGRSERLCDIVIPDEAVSRKHAELVWHARHGWTVRDLASRNGVRVNGRRIEEAPVARGDFVGIGNHAIALVEPEVDRAPQWTSDAGHTIAVSRTGPHRVTLIGESDDGRLRMADLELLSGLAAELRGVTSLHDRRALVCERMLRAPIHARSAAILRMPADGTHTGVVEVVSGPHTLPGVSVDARPSETLLRAVARTRAAAIASTEQDRSDVLDLTQTDHREAEAALACPLDPGEGPLDVLYITTSEAQGQASTLALASLCAHQFQQTENALVAGQQAEARARIEQELVQARTIQHRLVPPDGSIGAVEIAVLFRASRWVAGDYVDAVLVPGGQVLIIVADVCGKGLAAALVASTLHAITRTAAQAGAPVTQVFELLNDHLCAHLQDGMFVTAAGCVLDPAAGTVTTVNAGHPPPVITRSDGTLITMRSGQNFPLGIAHQDFETEQHAFGPASMLAMCSDGVTELNIGNRRMLGLQGFGDLLQRVRESGHRTAATLRDELERRLTELRGDEQSDEQADDCTLVIAGVPGPIDQDDPSDSMYGPPSVDPGRGSDSTV